ncbi:MAG TPA: hypothetical protein VNZ03_10550 [Terriglobales bacterium]|jgi:hypothetical protein|nr:hypothetical protein [Terriglobales bacterium]
MERTALFAAGGFELTRLALPRVYANHLRAGQLVEDLPRTIPTHRGVDWIAQLGEARTTAAWDIPTFPASFTAKRKSDGPSKQRWVTRAKG